MKMRSFLLLCGVSFAVILSSSADPILPFQQPIADQLNNDLAINSSDKTLNAALNKFHKTSKSLSGDITILRGLNSLLMDTAGYPPLLDAAANDYQSDFQLRRDALNEQLIPAPITATKTLAHTALIGLDKALSNAVNSVSTSARLTRLQSAATKLASASNAVQRALKAKSLPFSSVVARIGQLSMNATKLTAINGPAFVSGTGTASGQFTTDGPLDIAAFEAGAVSRTLLIHVDVVGTNVPAIYPLGTGGTNTATYAAYDAKHKLDYIFTGDAALTNAAVTNAFLSVDFIGTNFLIGRFAFVGTNLQPVSATDTNTLVTVSQGEFQLNFKR